MFKLTRGFYSRVLLISIVVICTVSILLALIIGNVAARQERLEYLKKYDIAISDLNLRFFTRHRNFQNDYKPLFQSPAQYRELCTLLRGDTNPLRYNAVRASASEMLSTVSALDFSSVGILLHSDITGDVFLYDPRLKTMERLTLQSEFPAFKPYGRGVLSSAALSGMGVTLSGISSKVYGIVGTLPDSSGSGSIGQMAVLYSVSDFTDTLLSHNLEAGAVVSIIAGDGDVVFRSSGDYHQTADLYLPAPGAEPADDYGTFETDAGRFDVLFLRNTQYDFTVVAQTPEHRGQMSTLIFVLAMMLCGIAILAYSLALRSSARKVRLIQRGMANVSANRLDLRIEEPKGDDEFAEIIRGFNAMCEQLEVTIKQLYIKEIQQKKAELYAMQTSINPHVLYNTLELIRVHTLHGSPQEASRMILLLSRVYRSQIGQKMVVTLEEELEHCENLILLNQYRQENFDYTVDIPPELMAYGIPKITLQPLIENYFVHGLDPDKEDNLLTLTGALKVRGGETFLVISVIDNGRSIAPDALEEVKRQLANSVFDQDTHEGFALYNVSNRLKIVYGEGCGLEAGYAEDGRGFRIDAVMRPMTPEQLSSSEGLR